MVVGVGWASANATQTLSQSAGEKFVFELRVAKSSEDATLAAFRRGLNFYNSLPLLRHSPKVLHIKRCIALYVHQEKEM